MEIVRKSRAEYLVIIRGERDQCIMFDCWSLSEARRVRKAIRIYRRDGGGSGRLDLLEKLARFTAERPQRWVRNIVTEFACMTEEERDRLPRQRRRTAARADTSHHDRDAGGSCCDDDN